MRPASTLGLQPSFGFGDRIGLATPGHAAAMRTAGAGFAPIFAQQSIREMTRTSRSPQGVMDDALAALEAVQWEELHGADADHLKTEEDVDCTAAAGFTFFTIDPSGHVDQQADDYDETTLRGKVAGLRESISWLDCYTQKPIILATGAKIDFTEGEVMRAAVKYGPAIEAAIGLADYICQVQTAANREHEIELSIDETEQPTSLAEHWIIADQCLLRGVKLVSLAPRFVGDFEKGVDYIGDVEILEQSLANHAAIARQLGPYKLSLHSGSDKLSMYPALARATQGHFHVKTAGTSYLAALRVIAIHEPGLFREICDFSRTRYDHDRATYHVHATLDNVAPPSELIGDRQLEQAYLERWEDVPEGQGFTEAGRQILHCTFGSVLTDSGFGKAFNDCVRTHGDTYTEVIAEHFSKHLAALQSGC